MPKYQIKVLEGENGYYESYPFTDVIYDSYEDAERHIPEDWPCCGCANKPYVAEVQSNIYHPNIFRDIYD